MSMTTVTSAARLEATQQQLLAEIAASEFRTIRRLADTMGVDYHTLTRHINGRAPLKMSRLYEILELLGVGVGEFFTSVEARERRSLRRSA